MSSIGEKDTLWAVIEGQAAALERLGYPDVAATLRKVADERDAYRTLTKTANTNGFCEGMKRAVGIAQDISRKYHTSGIWPSHYFVLQIEDAVTKVVKESESTIIT